MIARITLAPGQIGYYDEVSQIRLTAGSPSADITPGVNTTQLRHDVHAGKIRLVYGTLTPTVSTRIAAARPRFVSVYPVVEEPAVEPIIDSSDIKEIDVVDDSDDGPEIAADDLPDTKEETNNEAITKEKTEPRSRKRSRK